MAISSNMNFEVATLIDITNTGQTKFRSEDRLAINQQAAIRHLGTAVGPNNIDVSGTTVAAASTLTAA